jgi:GT2 family glycosyltransferase
MDSAPIQLSVVVASYNTRDLLRECLKSLAPATAGLRTEILVVDNHSTDGSAEMVETSFPEVTLLRNGANEGFAKANNRALAAARGDHVLCLNPDTLIPQGALRPMIEFLGSNQDVGIVGCRLERPDGRLDEACKRSFPTPLSAIARFLHLDRLFPGSRTLGAYRRTFQDPHGRYEVDSVVGAFMLVRRRVIEEVGGFDEDFFMFGEDLDWCYRVKSRRFKVYYLGDQKVIHHKGAATATAPYRMNWHFHRAMFLFHKKHLVDRYPFFVNWAVYTGISVRYALRSLGMALGVVRRSPVRVVPSEQADRDAEEGA